MRIHWGVLLGLAVVGCRSDPAPIANMAGTWAYEAPVLKDGSMQCGVTSLTPIIDQTGASFVGTYGGGILSCVGGATDTGFLGDVVSGTVAGTEVTFDFDNPNWENSGRLTGGTMTGETVWIVGLGTTVYHLAGTWTATKN